MFDLLDEVQIAIHGLGPHAEIRLLATDDILIYLHNKAQAQAVRKQLPKLKITEQSIRTGIVLHLQS